MPEAAQHLTKLSGEDINVADVLDLALQGRLKLSVNLVKKTFAKLYPDFCVDIDEHPKLEYDNFQGIGMIQRPGNNIIQIWGIFDLPMKGGEILDVQYEQQKYYVSSAVKYINTNGTYVEEPDGQIFQLQEYCKDEYSGCGIIPESIPFPKEEISGIPDLVRPINNSQKGSPEELPGGGDLEEEPTKVDNSNELNIQAPIEKIYCAHYIMRPAGCLPKDSLLIVRRSALDELD